MLLSKVVATRWPPGRDAPGIAVRVGLLFSVFSVMSGACVYDADNICGPGQESSSDGTVCVCAEGSAWTEQGCVPCGDNENPGSEGCVCAEGYSRAVPGGACEPVPEGQGLECDTEGASCTDPTFDHCQVVSGTTGYCTSTGCASSEDCEGGYACDLSASPSVCQRPPIGLSAPCQSDADCAGNEATYCDTFQTQSCLVMGCSIDPDDCFEGWECCDLTGFGVPAPFCVAEGECPT